MPRRTAPECAGVSAVAVAKPRSPRRGRSSTRHSIQARTLWLTRDGGAHAASLPACPVRSRHAKFHTPSLSSLPPTPRRPGPEPPDRPAGGRPGPRPTARRFRLLGDVRGSQPEHRQDPRGRGLWVGVSGVAGRPDRHQPSRRAELAGASPPRRCAIGSTRTAAPASTASSRGPARRPWSHRRINSISNRVSPSTVASIMP